MNYEHFFVHMAPRKHTRPIRKSLCPASAIQPARSFLFTLLAALLLFFLRFGYDYATSDQDEFLPYLLHLMHPELFAKDWFVQTQVAAFSVRRYVVYLLYGLASFLPVWLSVLILYLSAWLAIAAAVYVLAGVLTQNRLSAAVAVFAALVFTPQWTLGGNDLVHSMLAPSMLAWAAALWGLIAFLKRRYVPASLLLGLATAMQALVGLQMAGLLGVALLLERPGLRSVLVYGLTYALAAAPTLAPLVLQQIGGAENLAEPNPSLFYVMARFRNPHHYLFLSFPARSLIRFGLLLVLGLGSFRYLRWRTRLHHGRFLTHLFIVAGAMTALAFVFTEVAPALFVAKLQLFMMTVPAKLLLVILICGALTGLLPQPVHGFLDRALSGRYLLPLTLTAWALLLSAALLSEGYPRSRIHPFAREDSAATQIETWARANTPQDAVFAVPPSVSSFRSNAHRAIAVNFKAFPYRDEEAATWFTRLLDLAPIPLPERGSPALPARLDAAYMQLPAADLLELAARYRIDYFVRPAPLTPLTEPFEMVFQAGAWRVYRVNRDRRPPP